MNMSTQNLTKLGDQFPVAASPELVNNLADGEALTFADLSKVTVPTGGALSWTLETIDGETTTKTLTGLILDQALVRNLYERSFEESGGQDPALCSSLNSKAGHLNPEALAEGGELPARIAAIGRPSGECDACPLARYGTKPKKDGQPGRGQMCRQTRLLLFLQPGNSMPLVVSVPPSGLKAAKQYLVGLQNVGLEYWQVVTELELKKDSNRDGIKFSRVQFKFAGTLPQETITGIARYRESLKAMLKAA